MSRSDIFSLGTMIERMKQHEARMGTLPCKAFATSTYIKSLERGVEDTQPLVKDNLARPAPGAVAELLGMPIYPSTILPKGCLCMFLDKHNQPLGMIVDETYEKAYPTRDTETL